MLVDFPNIFKGKVIENYVEHDFILLFIHRLLQTIYFKLRTMIPCAICDLKFKLDFPETVCIYRI